MPKRNPDPAKILKASARATAHRAYEAGTVKVAYQATARVTKILADARVEADDALQNEIRIAAAALQRFRTKVRHHTQAKAGALRAALQEAEAAERLLRRAEGPGYGVVAVAQRAEVDARRLQALTASLQRRAREMAFVLAELEQVVDPLPGLRMASAAERRRNDRKRAAQAPAATDTNGSETTALS